MAIFTRCTICLYFYSFWLRPLFLFCFFDILPLRSKRSNVLKGKQCFIIILFKTGEGQGAHIHLRIQNSCFFFSFNFHVDCTIQASLYSEIQQRLNFAPCSGTALLAWKNEDVRLETALHLDERKLCTLLFLVGWFSHQGKVSHLNSEIRRVWIIVIKTGMTLNFLFNVTISGKLCVNRAVPALVLISKGILSIYITNVVIGSLHARWREQTASTSLSGLNENSPSQFWG